MGLLILIFLWSSMNTFVIYGIQFYVESFGVNGFLAFIISVLFTICFNGVYILLTVRTLD